LCGRKPRKVKLEAEIPDKDIAEESAVGPGIDSTFILSSSSSGGSRKR